jgi:hypothetical protein
MAVTKDGSYPVSATSAADGTSALVWPSFTTPGSDRFIVAILLGDGAGATAIDSFTSSTLSWTNRVSVVSASGTYRVEIWTATAASVVTTEVITTTHTASGLNYTRRSVSIFSFAGHNGVGNTASNTAVSGDPSLAVTATASGSYVLVGFPYRSSGSDTAEDGNTTSEYNTGAGGGFGFNQRIGSRTSSGAGALTLGWTGDDIFEATAIGGIEVLAGAVGFTRFILGTH